MPISDIFTRGAPKPNCQEEDKPYMFEEPSVLDYVKSKIKFWVRRLTGNSASDKREEPVEEAYQPVSKDLLVETKQPSSAKLPWSSLLAFGCALAAQISLEPRPNRTWVYGAFLYSLTAILLVVAYRRLEWQPAPLPEEKDTPIWISLRVKPLIISLFLGALAFLAFGGNRFTSLNVLLWTASGVSATLAFLDLAFIYKILGQILNSLRSLRVSLAISRWTILVLLALGIGVFFRFYLLNAVPSQMVSDHAEKLWDVKDLLEGQTRIYFPRNTGREFFQMYLTAGIISLFNTGLTFLSLKLGTVLCGVLTLPFIYLIGKEIANKQAGLLAMLFAGIAYWPNLISRIALRFTLYPFFYALTLYFFLRGINTKRISSFLLSGLFLGLGLHGYSPFRIVPILLMLAVLLYVLHVASSEKRRFAVYGLAAAGILAFIVFLPLLRYSLENPEMFWYRAMTRLSSMESPIQGNPLLILAQNFWNGLTMFAWDNGQVWVISVVHRPVLDFVSAALFHSGIVLILIRYLQRRHWHDLFLLLSIPVLMLPSILSIAFPGENPSLNRTAGAIVPVFLVIGVALEGLLRSIFTRAKGLSGKFLTAALGLTLFGLSASQNHDLVFNQYARIYELSSWNTSEMGAAVRSFSLLHGSPETAWLVASPHWADSRLVMINAGFPGLDNPIRPDQLAETLADPRPKMFIIRHNPRPEDQVEEMQVLNTLQQLYPQGWARLYPSQYPTKDFWLFYTPPAFPGVQTILTEETSTP